MINLNFSGCSLRFRGWAAIFNVAIMIIMMGPGRESVVAAATAGEVPNPSPVSRSHESSNAMMKGH